TLSCLSVLWPSRTASARARCRNKCTLSSREGKSTGPKPRVVIFPSTVIANVALTNGREVCDLRSRDAARAARTLLRLLDFMFHRRHFTLHFAQRHPFRDAARFVEEVNDAARRTADQNHEKAHRSDQFRDRNRNVAKVVEHDLQDLFAQTNARKADRQSRQRAFHRQHRKKIDQFYARMKSISDAKKSSEGGKMGHERHHEGEERRDPVPRVKMISRCDFD